ncbi:efflux RND transporter periplasmic adaptor subunit [Sulfurimonas sp.]|uniref:efflux RND transporter periplasmic adaptor subunit n=1 Tax=Sulfurimonas sp. TaxID=2022749 RepID=UPI003D14EEAB
MTLSKSILFLGCVGLLLNACSKDNSQEQQQVQTPPLQVETITIKQQEIPIWTSFTGKTKASSDQEIRARVSGILQERYFNDGDFVKKGQKLFKIEQDQYEADLKAANAKKAQDEAALKLANADVKRYEPLVKEGLAPRATLEQYESQQDSLKAAIEGDAAKIKQAELSLSYTIIKAPISGKISARYVDVGNLVSGAESTLLTTITSIDPLYAYFSPSNDAYLTFQKYKDKDKAFAFIELKSSIGDFREDGYVDFSDNMVDPETSTINMRAVIDNKKGDILPGNFVYVNIYINKTDTFKVIPPEIIFNDQLGKYVYVVDQNNTLKRADIETSYTTKYYVNVSKGLEFGDKVVISGLMKLKPDLKVDPTDVSDTKGVKAILEKNDMTIKETK